MYTDGPDNASLGSLDYLSIDITSPPTLPRSQAIAALPRSQAIGRLESAPLDTLVIGGGIVGAGVARDAALRGLRIGLAEQQDLAAGTSSRSSRLLHGGIRYLAQGRVGLVREASREKTVLHRIAPHLSRPLAFIFPTRKRSEWSFWKLALGVKLYDLLCSGRNLGRSQALGIAKTLELLPTLSQDRLTGCVRYFDGLTNDARLTLDTLRSAASHGAIVGNYLRFVDAAREQGLWRCELLDVETGTNHQVFTKSVVNATGPWSSRIPHSETDLRLTKGVHLVIDASRLPVPDAVVIAKDDRILFAIPWGKRVILGTTDTDYSGPLESPSCLPEDTEYVLAGVNQAFPTARLTAADVLSTWAGIRPLVADAHGDPSDISRRHEVRMAESGWCDVTGGKLTTYRLMAEETVDSIVRLLKIAVSPCQTASQLLLPEADVRQVSGILPPAVEREIVKHFCRQEWATHLDDVMVRRTSWRYYHGDHVAVAEQVADWMKDALGWDEGRTREELARYRSLTEQEIDS